MNQHEMICIAIKYFGTISSPENISYKQSWWNIFILLDSIKSPGRIWSQSFVIYLTISNGQL